MNSERKERMRRPLAACILGLLLTLLFIPGFRAYGGSLTITGTEEGVLFSLWKIGEEKDGQIVLTETCGKYRTDFGTGERIPQSVLALEGYLRRDGIPADRSGIAGSGGTIRFSGLREGLYLIGGTAPRKEQGRTEVQPGLVLLGGSSAGEMTVKAKLSHLPAKKSSGGGGGSGSTLKNQAGEEEESLLVRKCWEDGNSGERPSSITVDLLENGIVRASAVLSEDNGWQAEFSGLSSRKIYTALEREVPEGYRVSLEREGNELLVVNRRESIPPVPDRIPQTGPFLWPLLFTLPAGVLLFMFRQKKGNRRPVSILGAVLLLCSFFVFGENVVRARSAGNAAQELLEIRHVREMPEAETGGEERIKGESAEQEIEVIPGVPQLWELQIPALDLRLPVYPDWSMEKLRNAPCCYRKAEEEEKLVICAHNYPSHFGRIGTLSAGDRLYLDDGEKKEYVVVSSEILMPGESERLLEGPERSLTLVTCTPGGAARIAVRLISCGEENTQIEENSGKWAALAQEGENEQ